MRIYLDNAATTPMLPEVIEVMTEIMKNDFGNPSSIHQQGRKSKAIIENARKTVAKVINASIGEIYFTSSATEANNMMLKNAVQDLDVETIISSPTEHHCVLHTLHYLQEKKGVEVIFLNVDGNGNIDIIQLEKLLGNQTKKTLVSIMHGNNEIGTMADINQIGKMCRQYQALFHCDTVQTMGKYPINVQESCISFLSGSSHKFHGPKGVGFAFISNENIISPYLHGGSQERNMRAGTENIAGIAGLASALSWADANMEANQERILNLREKIKDALSTQLTDIQFNGNQEQQYMAHVLSVSFPPSPKAELLVMNLDIAGISASSGSACTAGIEEDSHVLQAIGHPSERKAIRFSFSTFNTETDVLTTVEKLKTMI